MMIRDCIQSGRLPSNLHIVDAHAHLGDGEQGGAYIRSLPLDESLRLSRKIGIDAIVASSLKALYGSVPAGNERMMELTRLYPDYVYASIYYHPLYHDECIRQIEKYRGDPGFVGIKIHPRDSGASIAAGDYERLYGYCVDHDILVAGFPFQPFARFW